MATIWNYGSINIDHVYQLDHLVQAGETISSRQYDVLLGGKGANQSVALAKAGATVRHVGYVGQQDAWVIRTLSEYGVNCDAIETVDGPSGHAMIQVDQQGENAIIVFPGANRSQPISHTLEKITSHAGDWFITQNETNDIFNALTYAKTQGMKIALNPSPFEVDFALKALPLVDLLVVNEGEFYELMPEAHIESLDDAALLELKTLIQKQWPDKTIVITMGSMGAIWVSSAIVVWRPAPKVNVVDTTGAGDTFLGYLLASIANEHPVEIALERAVVASALSVQRAGAAQSIPDEASVKEYLHSMNR